MSDIDVDALLAAISEDSPCGENLEYDADFGSMERAAEGSPEQQIGESVIPVEDPDWRQVKSLAVELFSRTKDLRVAIYLTRAALQLDGIAGFRDGLTILHGLVEQYWTDVYPQLDPEDEFVGLARKAGCSIQIERDADKAVEGADLIVADTWVSMHDSQSTKERRHNQLRPYQGK